MREIKFRVWDSKNKKFVYFEGIFNKLDDNLIGEIGQQYTCMKDKNGKYIYEGDIVKLFNGQIHKVEFIEESNEIQMSGYCFSSFGSEIIGNIFETPELLEQ